ncbi:MAG TPA: SLC13 family permease [Candidatus Baltobacteraceae bacterium]|nr:SLC13 family permease [Candidatus Baltobacteraceae bacterium]
MALLGWPVILISVIAIAGMIFWPRRAQEWIWAAGGAALLVLLGAISPTQALAAVMRGRDVYAFLVGIMALAELARHERLFDWLATRVLDAAGGSQRRLFTLVYLLGAGVTALLCNDTTAIVLTPAISAALVRTDADPSPYLFACAFVANAASFIFPISNPANLVVFGPHLPALHVWLADFALASLAAIIVTYFGLRLFFRADLQSAYRVRAQPAPLPAAAALSGAAIGIAALALVIAATLRLDVGITALAGAIACAAVVSLRERGVLAFVARHVAWQIVPLVAGLFVIVAALDRAGVIDLLRLFFHHAQSLGYGPGNLLSALLLTAADNVFNNLPVALASGFALQSAPVSPAIAHAALVAVDLGPNVSVTGSLATMLWLIALRREGFRVRPVVFLGIGLAITLPAMALAVLLVR